MGKKLHILFLSHWFPSRNFPKGGNFILRHAQAISTMHKVTVLFAEGDKNNKLVYEVIEENKDELRVIYIYYKYAPCKLINYWRKFKAYTKGLKRVGNFDLIHLNVLHYYALIAIYFKLFKNINFVITEHWTKWIRTEKTFSAKWYYSIMKIICSYSSYILPVSNNLADNMKQKGIKGDFEVIPNVVDTNIFIIKDKKEKKKTFLHISGLNDQHKNFSGILKVTKKLINEGYDFILNIGGDGDVTPIHTFINENNLEKNIFVFEELNEDEVADKMKQADVFILFSNRENQPCVINESFSCGLPVIATRVGGICEFFPKDFGILIEKGNEEELYQAMKSCIENKTDFAHSETMHEYAEHFFGVKPIAENFDKVYQKTLKKYS